MAKKKYALACVRERQIAPLTNLRKKKRTLYFVPLLPQSSRVIQRVHNSSPVKKPGVFRGRSKRIKRALDAVPVFPVEQGRDDTELQTLDGHQEELAHLCSVLTCETDEYRVYSYYTLNRNA